MVCFRLRPNLVLFSCISAYRLRLGRGVDYCMGGNCFSSITGSSMSQPVVVPPSGKHTATVIFMHGLGDSGHGWSPVMQMIKQPHIKYICPHAVPIPVSLNMGMVMPSWFDIRGLDPNAEEDETGIKAATNIVKGWIEEETKSGISSSRIVVGGFSQGGGLALYSGFTYDKPLAGIIALSAWLPLHKQFPAAAHDANKKTPIFQGHGDADPLVIPFVGQRTGQYIKAFNPNHTLKMYPGMPHSSCEQEIDDIKTFIQQVLPPQ